MACVRSRLDRGYNLNARAIDVFQCNAAVDHAGNAKPQPGRACKPVPAGREVGFVNAPHAGSACRGAAAPIASASWQRRSLAIAR